MHLLHAKAEPSHAVENLLCRFCPSERPVARVVGVDVGEDRGAEVRDTRVRSDSLRCGCRWKVRQMRPMVLWLIPAALAIDRVLQCVSPEGVVSSVLTMTASMVSSVILRGAPTRGSSYSPSRRRSTN